MIPWRNENDNALASTREQNAIRVAQINTILNVRDIAPPVATKIVIIPSRPIESKIAAPCHAYPVEFQTLHLKFRRCVFEIIARSCVISAVKKVVNWIN